MTDEKIYCLECGDELPYGRPDRKFCCHSCKNKFHNKKHIARRSFKLRIEHILSKNYRVLSQFLNAGITTVPMSGLCLMGFNAQYTTSSYRQGHRTIKMCFDITYYETSTKIFGLKYIEEMPE